MKLRTYLTGATIIWAGTILATAVVLQGTPYLAQMLPILLGGAVWFIVIVPGATRRGTPSDYGAVGGEHDARHQASGAHMVDRV